MRSVYPSMKAARRYGRAVRLEAAGKHAKAFELTTLALASLPEPEGVAGLTEGARLSLTVLHAQLATRLGRPELAQPEIRKALQAYGHCNTNHPAVRDHLNWLRSQLEQHGNERT